MHGLDCSGVVVRALFAGGVAAAGCVSAQPIVIDWLAPSSGLWSDPANWADGNVPDSSEEAARISPSEGRGLDQPAAFVDGNFEVEELTGNGLVDVAVAGGGQLSVGSIIRGTGVEPLVVRVGDDSGLGEPARLETLGTIRGTVSRIEGNVQIVLDGEQAEFEGIGRARFDGTAILRGNGIVRGEIFHSGQIIAEPGLSDTLLFEGGDVFADELIATEGSTVVIRDSFAVAEFFADRGTFLFDEATVASSTIDRTGAIGTAAVVSPSRFEDVFVASQGELVVRERLEYVASDGIFLNEGRVIIEAPGRIDLDDTPSQTLLMTDGDLELRTDTSLSAVFRIQADDELIILPFARVRGEGVVFGDVFNLGNVRSRVFSIDGEGSELRVVGDFEQDRTGQLEVGVVQEIGSSSFGPVAAQRLDVNGNVILGGELVVDFAVLEADAIAGVPIVILQHSDPRQDFTFEGEFDSVFLGTRPQGISDIPRLEYADDVGVTLTLFCTADVNRNAVVDGQDFSAWILAYNQRDPLADQNSDGVITPADFSAWISNFNAGCGR